MNELLETEVEKIDTNVMYKMIEELIERDMYYETKCFVNILIEKRKDTKELEILCKIKELLFEYKIFKIKEMLKNTSM